MQPLRNTKGKIKILALTALLAFLLFAPMALGQTTDPVRYLVAPETPGPNTTVAIQADGVGSFLGEARITWTVNGVVAKSGVGERLFSFKTGALGTRSVVSVRIVSDTQGTLTRSFTFSPSLVNMVWEADTTVPPLYRGKALYSPGSGLKIVAFPVVYSGSSRVSAGALSYQWFRNEELLTAQSGLGKASLSFTGDQLLDGENVAVDVYYGTNKAARGEITIAPTDPFIALYERSAVRGVLYDQAFPQSIQLLEQEITVQAEPFYFSSAAKKNSLLQYSWTLNGTSVSGPDSAQGVLTLRQAGSGAGQTDVNVQLQNTNGSQLVQQATTALRLLFGNQNQGPLNLFGL